MGLILVRGGIEHDAPSRPSVRDIEREARRRLAAFGYDNHMARERLTGVAIPKPVRILHLQIMAVAMGLAALETIPDDYRSDIYWPQIPIAVPPIG